MATPSHARKPSVNSRPTTPLRPPSRTSLRASQTTPSGPLSSSSDPLASLEPAFAELSDSMADLEANFMHLQLLNESLNRFNECFGGFLYGLNMSAFCVDFPEAPTPQSFARAKNFSSPNSKHHPDRNIPTQTAPPDVDATFLTTDTSFVEHPPTTSKPPSRYSSVPSARTPARGSTRGGASASTAGRGARGSGIARGGMTGATRGARGGATRGAARGRGTATGWR